MEGHAGETNRVGAYNHKRAKTKNKQKTRGVRLTGLWKSYKVNQYPSAPVLSSPGSAVLRNSVIRLPLDASFRVSCFCFFLLNELLKNNYTVSDVSLRL